MNTNDKTVNKDTRLSIKVDSELKNSSTKVLNEIGLDLSTAVRIFLTQVTNTRKIPFELSAKTEYTTEEVMGNDWRERVKNMEDDWE